MSTGTTYMLQKTQLQQALAQPSSDWKLDRWSNTTDAVLVCSASCVITQQNRQSNTQLLEGHISTSGRGCHVCWGFGICCGFWQFNFLNWWVGMQGNTVKFLTTNGVIGYIHKHALYTRQWHMALLITGRASKCKCAQCQPSYAKDACFNICPSWLHGIHPSAAELYIRCNHDAVCAALFNSLLLKQLQARLQNKINSCSGVIVSTCLSCEWTE